MRFQMNLIQFELLKIFIPVKIINAIFKLSIVLL